MILGPVLVADAGDLAGGRDQVAEDGLAFDDPGVLRGEDRGGRLVREGRKVRTSADLLQVAATLECLRDRDDVDRLTTLPELHHRGVDAAVGLPVEVLRVNNVGDLDDRIAIDEERAEDRLLGFDALGWKAVEGHADSEVGGRNRIIVAVACRARHPDVHELAAISPVWPGRPAGCVESLWTTGSAGLRRPEFEPPAGGLGGAEPGRGPGVTRQSRRRITPMSLPWIRTAS